MGTKMCINSEGWKLNQKHVAEISHSKKIKRIEEYNRNPKKCKTCNKSITYEKKDNDFCSHRCSALFTNYGRIRKNKIKKICLNCNTLLVTRNSSKYCSSKCQSEYQYNSYIKKWKNGEVDGMRGDGISLYIRRYIFEKFNNKCTVCGWSKVNQYTGTIPLTIDHIDGNSSHNKEENLNLLCPSCHSLTPTYCGLNRGRGRTNRRIKIAKLNEKIKKSLE